MLNKYLLINIIVLSMVCFIGYKLYSIMSLPVNFGDLVMPLQQQKDQAKRDLPVLKDRPPVFTRYASVSDKNLFRPQREEYKPPTPTPAPTEAPQKRKIELKGLELYGVVIAGPSKRALISEQSIEKGKPLPYKEQDKLAGFTISRIFNDKVILTMEGQEDVTLLLRDRSKRRSYSSKAQQPPTTAHPPRRSFPSNIRTREDMAESALPFLLRQAHQQAMEQGKEQEPAEPPPLPPFLMGLTQQAEEYEEAREGPEDESEEEYKKRMEELRDKYKRRRR